MAFGKKKPVVSDVTQENVALKATQALANMRMRRVRLLVEVKMTTPILMHRWQHKAVAKMVGKMVGQPQPKQDLDLTGDYEESWYRNEENALVMPCRVFKAAIVTGGGDKCGGVVSGAQLRRELRVMGHTAPIVLPKGKKMEMSVMMAKTDSGTPYPLARAEIPTGSRFKVVLDFPPTLSADQVMAACGAAGEYVGLCDYRPGSEKGGEFGCFNVDVVSGLLKDIEATIKACSVPELEFKIPEEMLRAFNVKPRDEMPDVAKKVRSRANGTPAHESDG